MKILKLQIPLEHLVHSGLTHGTRLITPFIYTTKDISTLGTSNPPYRALLFYQKTSIFNDGWDIPEISKKVGKEFFNLDIEFKYLTIYNGIYAFGSFEPFNPQEMADFQHKTKKAKVWYKDPILKFNYSLDDYISKP
jgi:hypothetical protein